MLADELFEQLLVGSAHLFDLAASLEELECGHGLDSACTRNFFSLIDIDLDKIHLGSLFG